MEGRNLCFPSHSKVEKRTQLVSILSFRWREPAGQPTQDVYGGLQDVLSQQEHPLAEGGGLIRAAETIGVSSLQEG